MTVPSRNDLMIRNLMRQNRKVEKKLCHKQFPDCPSIPTKELCKLCPFVKSLSSIDINIKQE